MNRYQKQKSKQIKDLAAHYNISYKKAKRVLSMYTRFRSKSNVKVLKTWIRNLKSFKDKAVKIYKEAYGYDYQQTDEIGGVSPQ